MANDRLIRAMKNKNDEFYTQLSDIENEVSKYKDYFKGKVVLCNCDDPRVSNFFHYFSYSFEHLGLKKLITTCYKSQNMDLFSKNESDKAIYLEYYGDKNGNRIPDVSEIGVKPLKGDGDFIRLLDIDCYETSKNPRAIWQSEYYHLSVGKVIQKGEYSKQRLKDLLGKRKDLKLEWNKRDRYRRILGKVYLDDRNINDYMLSEGGCEKYVERKK